MSETTRPAVVGEEYRIQLDSLPDRSGAEVVIVVREEGGGHRCSGMIGTTTVEKTGTGQVGLALEALVFAKRTLHHPDLCGVTPAAAAILTRKVRTKIAALSPPRRPKKQPPRFVIMTPEMHALADGFLQHDHDIGILFRFRLAADSWTKGLNDEGRKIPKPFDVRVVPLEVRRLYGQAVGWEPEVMVTFCYDAWTRAEERGKRAVEALVRSATHAIQRAPFGKKDEYRTFVSEPDLVARTSVVAAVGVFACGIAVPVAEVLHAANDHGEIQDMKLVPVGQETLLEAPDGEGE